MKKTKLITIFIIAIFIAALNFISMNSFNNTFVGNDVVSQNYVIPLGNSAWISGTSPKQSGDRKASGEVELSCTKGAKFKLKDFKVDTQNGASKKSAIVVIKEGTSEFGLKHITISDLYVGNNKLTYHLIYNDGTDHDITQPQSLSVMIKPVKSNTAIIVTAVIVPLVLIVVGAGIYYYINSKKKEKMQQKTDIEKMTIND